jgi:hypothetical protein
MELVVSREAHSIRQAVRRAVIHRNPAGYNADLLQGYVPDRAFYLPVFIRNHLAKIGVTHEQGIPAETRAQQMLDRLLIVFRGVPVGWRATPTRNWIRSR